MDESNKKQKTGETDIETLVREQVEYYFSNSNMRKDKWMQKTCSENDGYLPVEKLLDFNKLADLLKAHNKDLDFLTSAILKSEVLSFSDDHKMVKRKFPLPEVDDSKERTLVISGLPTDPNQTSIESVKEYFNQFGKVLSVNLQKNKEKQLTGSAFVEFEKVDDVKKASEAELKFKDSVLTGKLRTVFDEERKALREEENKKKESEEKKKEIVKGVLIKVNNTPFEGVEAIDIRKFFTELYGNVKFVDTNSAKESNHIYVRFSDLESAEKAIKALQAKECKYNDKEVEGHLVEGEEEENYWNEKVLTKTSTQSKKGKRKRR